MVRYSDYFSKSRKKVFKYLTRKKKRIRLEWQYVVLYIRSSYIMALLQDVTNEEIRNIIRSLWGKYFPNESSDFIDQLEEDHLIAMLKLISTKNKEKQRKIWEWLHKDIDNTNNNLKNIIKQANQKMLHIREMKDSIDNDTDNLLSTSLES